MPARGTIGIPATFLLSFILSCVSRKDIESEPGFEAHNFQTDYETTSNLNLDLKTNALRGYTS
jgi:hypothetical protein